MDFLTPEKGGIPARRVLVRCCAVSACHETIKAPRFTFLDQDADSEHERNGVSPLLPPVRLSLFLNHSFKMGYYRYRRYNRYRHSKAAAHIAERQRLSSTFGGIDQDIERIFLDLPSHTLEAVFFRYGKLAGSQAESYARATFHKWKQGSVQMSGVVAERLLNLVPPVLDAGKRFDLVKKLRAKHFIKAEHYFTAAPQDWREKLIPLINQVVAEGSVFRLPPEIVARVCWLADGDSVAAQALLAAVDQEEASIRLSYVESEFRRLEALVSTIDRTPKVVHKICLPQGDITVTIATPEKSFWRSLFGIK